VRLFLSLMLLAALTVSAQDMFTIGGKLHSKRVQQTQRPKDVIDTLRLSSGVGYLLFSTRFNENTHSTQPTKGGFVYGVVSGYLYDTAQDVYSYSIYISSDRDTLIVKSSNNADTNLVVVRALVK
jgi:hypothetical protein